MKLPSWLKGGIIFLVIWLVLVITKTLSLWINKDDYVFMGPDDLLNGLIFVVLGTVVYAVSSIKKMRLPLKGGIIALAIGIAIATSNIAYYFALFFQFIESFTWSVISGPNGKNWLPSFGWPLRIFSLGVTFFAGVIIGWIIENSKKIISSTS
jgi:hypothetical protein